MKKLKVKKNMLISESRWDLDYHLPSIEIKKFPASCLKRVSDVAEISKAKWNPESNPEEIIKYVDISCINIDSGEIHTYQELLGSDAPSRARKLIQKYDVIVSTVRPTRRAIAVVEDELHNEICSTGFSVLRPKLINPFYLRFALRLSSTSEQFRKFATGSSYPAILDTDVLKTLIPVPSIEEQDSIVIEMIKVERERSEAIRKANSRVEAWENSIIPNLHSGSDIPDLVLETSYEDFKFEKILESINSIDLKDLRNYKEQETIDQSMLDFLLDT